MKKIKCIALLFIAIATTSFCKTPADIDDIVVKIKYITYAPTIYMESYPYAETGMTYEKVRLSLTNTGDSDYTMDLTKSYLTDNEDNIWYLTSPKSTKVVIKSGKEIKTSLFYYFPEGVDPKYIILGDKVFEAKVYKKK